MIIIEFVDFDIKQRTYRQINLNFYKGEILMKIKKISLFVICMLVLSSSFCFADSHSKSIPIENIQGGVKIINGQRYEMSKEEAQAEFAMENVYSEKITPIENSISPFAIVKTQITSQKTVNGKNVRISPITHNKTSSNIVKTIIGEKTFSGTFPKIVSGELDGNIYYVTE